jgi:hypothetical protein
MDSAWLSICAEQLAVDLGRRQGGQVQRNELSVFADPSWWIARAANSLPVPLSPSIRTVRSVFITLAMIR